MSKLLKLKEWLTLEHAARHLSGVCGEPVSEADVLRLGLDGHLKLSVHFVNHARARRGIVVSLEEAETCIFARDFNNPLRDMLARLSRARGVKSEEELPVEVTQGLQDGSLFHCITDIQIREGQFLHLADKVESITGVWDLPLIGAEMLDVEHAFQQLTGGPEVTLTVLDGTFVEDAAGQIAQIQDRFDSPEMGAMRQEVADQLKAMGGEKELKSPDKKLSPDDKRNYFPAGGLPRDSVLVVRTAALAEFQKLLAEQDSEDAPVAMDKSVGQRERATLLTMIAALAKQADIDWSRPSKAAELVDKLTSEMGARIPARTAEEHLKRIPDALERRGKNQA